jgi:outer membrane protein assembly factor BamD
MLRRSMSPMPLSLPGPALRAVCCVAAALVLAACGSTPKDETAKLSVEELYAQAKEDQSTGSYDKAIKAYERLEGRAAGTPLAQQAQLELAYAHWKAGERVEALAALERFIKLHPTSPAFDYALYLKGLINFNDNLGILGNFARQDLSERDQQASRDSYQAFKQLVERFPQSQYAPDARQRMTYIVNSLAAYEVHVARYYYRRGAYVAAANRAQQTVQEFQQSPSAEEALFLMARSYDRLGLDQLRDDAERVLRQNYPDSDFLREGLRERAKPWWQVW